MWQLLLSGGRAVLTALPTEVQFCAATMRSVCMCRQATLLKCFVTVVLPQELIDSARRLLDSNSRQLAQLCSRAGFSPPDDQGVHDAYGKAVQEWQGQVLAKHAGEQA